MRALVILEQSRLTFVTRASEDSRDVEVLKKAALQRTALDYRDTTSTYYELKRRSPTYPAK